MCSSNLAAMEPLKPSHPLPRAPPAFGRVKPYFSLPAAIFFNLAAMKLVKP
jgi:hypothetical protein